MHRGWEVDEHDDKEDPSSQAVLDLGQLGEKQPGSSASSDDKC